MGWLDSAPQWAVPIAALIAGAAFFIAAFKRQAASAVKIAVRGIVGIGGVYLANLILSPFGAAAGINPLNAAVIGFFGLPGFLGLYIMLFLKP